MIKWWTRNLHLSSSLMIKWWIRNLHLRRQSHQCNVYHVIILHRDNYLATIYMRVIQAATNRPVADGYSMTHALINWCAETILESSITKRWRISTSITSIDDNLAHCFVNLVRCNWWLIEMYKQEKAISKP
jgi:hypothetical protein